MIAPAAAPLLLRLSDAAAVLTLAAVAAALLLTGACAAVPDHLRPGAWSQDRISAPAALALLAVNWRLRQGWAKGWLIWAGLIGYLICTCALQSLDQVTNPAHPLHLAVLAASVLALVLFARAVDPAALISLRRPPPRRIVAGLFGLPVVPFTALWPSQLPPAMAARQRLPGQAIVVRVLAFALPPTGLTARLLWGGSPIGDLMAMPMPMKVAVLGVSVFLGTLYTWVFFDGPLLAFDLPLYALMGCGPAALIWPFWCGLEVSEAAR